MGNFHDYYKTLLDRNDYSQYLRQYVYTPYSNKKYYSDCSSSICATYQKMGIKVGLLNTAGMYKSGAKVKVEIRDGHIVSGFDKLRVGDALLFRGYPYDNADRPLGIGHVEAIYELGTCERDTIICGHGSDKPSLKNMEQYLSMREHGILQNGQTKGLVAVVRFINTTDDTYLSKGYKTHATSYINNDVECSCSADLTVTADKLLVRSKPDYSVRDRWFKIPEGYISAYKVEGWVHEEGGSWWYIEDDFKYPRFCAKEINGKEYHFDKHGYLIMSDRISPDGDVTY